MGTICNIIGQPTKCIEYKRIQYENDGREEYCKIDEMSHDPGHEEEEKLKDQLALMQLFDNV